MPQFLGFDHVDTRVRSLTAVEAFYDILMPEPGEHYNTIEYHENPADGRPAHFIGFIEDPTMKPVSTRIAFRVASVGELDRWVALLGRIGACNIEPSSSDWPALFFEDPAGTKLEIVAREP